MINKIRDTITKSETTFWASILSVGVTVALTFASLSGKLELLNQKVDNLGIQLDKMETIFERNQSRILSLSERMGIVEALIGVKK